MVKDKERIRYKYRKVKSGVSLKEIRCPICGNPINSTEVVEHTSWAGKVGLLAECWSGDIHQDKSRHLFLIRLENLPEVEVSKVKNKSRTKKEHKR